MSVVNLESEMENQPPLSSKRKQDNVRASTSEGNSNAKTNKRRTTNTNVLGDISSAGNSSLLQENGDDTVVFDEGTMEFFLEVPADHDYTPGKSHEIVDNRIPESLTLPNVEATNSNDENDSDGSVDDNNSIEVLSLLKTNKSKGVAPRVRVSYKEIRRRIKSPENLKLEHVKKILRKGKSGEQKDFLVKFMEKHRMKFNSNRARTSVFSQLAEADVEFLVESFKDVVIETVDTKSGGDRYYQKEIEGTDMAVYRAKKYELAVFRRILKLLTVEAIGKGSDFDYMTHGFGPNAISIVSDILDRIAEVAENRDCSDM